MYVVQALLHNFFFVVQNCSASLSWVLCLSYIDIELGAGPLILFGHMCQKIKSLRLFHVVHYTLLNVVHDSSVPSRWNLGTGVV